MAGRAERTLATWPTVAHPMRRQPRQRARSIEGKRVRRRVGTVAVRQALELTGHANERVVRLDPGAGLVVQSLLAPWLFQRFNLSLGSAGSLFFWTGVLAAGSFLLAMPLAERFGLINTMVFTHLPSNVLLVLVPFMPSLPLAVALLLLRSALSQMDVPTRSSYVMAVVPPAERPAAASMTSVPRSLASALGPLLAGYLLSLSPFGWPLVAAGLLKGVYDVLLLALFARVRPPEEQRSERSV